MTQKVPKWFNEKMLKKYAAIIFCKKNEIAAFASQLKNREFFNKEKFPLFKNGHLFLSFFSERAHFFF